MKNQTVSNFLEIHKIILKYVTQSSQNNPEKESSWRNCEYKQTGIYVLYTYMCLHMHTHGIAGSHMYTFIMMSLVLSHNHRALSHLPRLLLLLPQKEPWLLATQEIKLSFSILQSIQEYRITTLVSLSKIY